MQNLWNQEKASSLKTDLEFRVYTSNLLGQSDELVLHGGGNTSVKSKVDGEDILYVKGSGWDLVSIKEEGFAPVKLDVLKEMAKLKTLSDSDMVSQQKAAMIDKSAPNPSVEAILHAIIPYKFVDHTHADAVVTISNSKTGIENIKKIFPNFLIVPYVMPGFILAKKIYEMCKDINWESCEGIILHNHGIFTFDDDAKKSYDKMIAAVSLAEEFLEKNASLKIEKFMPRFEVNLEELQKILSQEKGYEVSLKINQSALSLHYASQNNLNAFATRGVLTPEHIIRTKREPLILEDKDIQKAIDRYKKSYIEYFNKFAKDEVMLNPSPNWIVVKNYGTITIGKTEKEANIIDDIITHTMNAVLKADKLGGYESISLKDSFEMEYWELEQAKLKK
ncbi:class II aldolase/adducin family protein [Halarcobacter ebronensis]|uniref:Oxidoreductase n=1 Tax=Halarcobacter ebronensis TaxID=1462615 RepID=A0A4Q1APL8_9BACT|nr:class II aldolase/adducin family protein [Halarcobacter ebronensis]QKF80766.1 short-chain dehydrogenase/reductase, putative rhamnose-utilization protein [Halarcobacter ebronensis]RXK08559.1 oxidoreductase [Halarcobacter ebronensis]